MITIDILLGLLTVWAVWNGWRKGLIRQLGSLAAVIIAVFLSRWLAPEAPGVFMGLLSDNLKGTVVGNWVAVTALRLAVFAAAYFAVMLLVRVLHMAVHAVMLGPVNRACGAVASLFKWWLAASLVFNLWLCIKPQSTFMHRMATGEGGRLVEMVTGFAPWLWGYTIASAEESPADAS